MQKTDQSLDFYRDAMRVLITAKVPFLVGGAYALAIYTKIERHTKDFDLFLRERDIDAAMHAFEQQNFRVERTHPHWLAKAYCDDDCIDLIYRAGNGLCEVDDSWFERAIGNEALGIPVKLVAPEEIIWMKAFIMERERYDGADIAHLLYSCAEKLDWQHLVRRFGEQWRVLLSHLVLFGFIYPAQKQRIPESIVSELLQWTVEDQHVAEHEAICHGTLLSRAQYLIDVNERGLGDARLNGKMTPVDVERWTAAINREE
ncbi:MAG: nucleotidyltransferase [Chthoniobacterales bacterium]